jgi:hypothetical protein
MKRSISFVISATIVLLAIILVSHVTAAPTIISPRSTTPTQQNAITTSPSVIQKQAINPATIAPQIGSAVITVRDGVGSPVSAATVSMLVNGQAMIQLTNAQGEASFMSIPLGQYSYSVNKGGYYSPLPTMALTIGRGFATTASSFVLFQYGSAKVKVQCNGTPLAGATVTATVSGKAVNQTTDANGLATFSNLIQGSYLFSVDKTGYTTIQTTVNVAYGQEANVPITTSILGSAKVKITCNGNPVLQAFVNVVYGNSSYSYGTDANGLASFKIPPGSYLFKADKASDMMGDYVGSQATVNIVSAQETSVTIPITLNFGSLAVTVKDPSFAELVSGATVTISSADGRSQSATTNAQGIATFSNLKLGMYTVKASKSGYSPLFASDSVSISAPKSYQLAYTLKKLYTILSVYALKQGGQPSSLPLDGVTVNLIGSSGVSQTLTTNIIGRVDFNLQPGDYIVSTNKAGYTGSSKDIHIVYSATINTIFLMIEMAAAP